MTGIMVFFAAPATLILGVLAISSSWWDHTGDTAFRIGRLWGKYILLITGCKVDVEGSKYIETQRRYIFVANHQSIFDIVVLMGYLPIQFRWVAKKELFGIPFFGQSMASIGCIPIDRGRSKSAFRSLMEAARKVRQGRSVMLFPEGTRSRDGRVQPFKAGAFYLAGKSGCPVVPIALLDTDLVMARGTCTVNPSRMKLVITPPVSHGRTGKTREDLAQEAFERISSIRNNHERIRQESDLYA